MVSWGWDKDGDTSMGTQALSEDGDRDSQRREQGRGPGHREKDKDGNNVGCTRSVGDSWMMLICMSFIPYSTQTLHYMVNITTRYLNFINTANNLQTLKAPTTAPLIIQEIQGGTTARAGCQKR